METMSISGVYHCILMLLMLPLSLMGRGFYRRKEEGKKHPLYTRGNLLKPVETREIMTSTFSLSGHCNNNISDV